MNYLHRGRLRCRGGRGAASGILGKAAAHALLEELEGALLGDETELLELLDSLEASRVLPTAHDAAGLRLHQVLLDKATGSVLGAAMEHLGLRANRWHGATGHSVITILTGVAVLTRIGHFGFCLIPRKVE